MQFQDLQDMMADLEAYRAEGDQGIELRAEAEASRTAADHSGATSRSHSRAASQAGSKASHGSRRQPDLNSSRHGSEAGGLPAQHVSPHPKAPPPQDPYSKIAANMLSR